MPPPAKPISPEVAGAQASRPKGFEGERRLDPEIWGIAERLQTPLWIFDVDRSRVVWANRPGLALWRADSLEALKARDLADDMSPAIRTRLVQYRDDLANNRKTFSEIWTLYPGGDPTTLRIVLSGHVLDDGRTAILCEALEELRDTPERLRSAEALLHTPVMITLCDPEGRPIYRNPAARRATPHQDADLASRFVDPADHALLLRLIEEGGTAKLVAPMDTDVGRRWHEISASRCHDAVNGAPALLVSETDVTAHKTAETRVRFLAEHDPLTGLPNRAAIQTEVTRRIENARASGKQVGLLFIDLDRFKTINDSLGHACGDALLIEAARRLQTAVSAKDFVARLGGDEFLVCVNLDINENRSQRLARDILQAFEEPMRVSGHELSVSASIGIGVQPQDGEDLDTLMRHADLAMYSAKEHGRNRATRFNTEMKAEVESQLELESSLRRALEHDEFELWYQPRLAIGEDRIVGAEALLRWHHPIHGLVLPGVFVPHAERTGLIDRIGASVLYEAAQQQRQWREAGHDIVVSVNLSARQFSDPRLMGTVAAIVADTGCDPRRLQIEITESMLVGHDETSTETLAALSRLGFSIAIDDFGTGYSNLATIQRHPIDTLKIDRSFVATLESQPALAELIIGMCRLLDMRIVAEGVESEEQLAWLKARNCHEYQGYLFSPAVPADTFGDYLVRQAELAAAGVTPGTQMWDLAPMVDRLGDIDWLRDEAAPTKVRRLRVSDATEGFG